MSNTQDIITAVKNLDVFLKVQELKGAKPRLNSNGNPFVFTGGFNMVFQLDHQNKKWAFRIWHVPIGENKDRYRKISKYLSEKKLPYFADFIFDEKGILVNGKLMDTIRMEWLEGKLLKEFIEDNLSNKAKLTKLANELFEMFKTLRENKISHGDLQEGNILIDSSGKLKLVDYDSVCIPEIEGQKELVTGLKGYQHPSRFKKSEASLKADYFSELIIYLSILALSENSKLWEKYKVKDTSYLLFSESDFEDFENSEIYNDLQKLSGSIKSLVKILKEFISESNYLNLKGFEHYLIPPQIINFRTNKQEILQGESIELSWIVENADTIRLNNGIGSVTGKNTIHITTNESVIYRLISENIFGKTEKEINITVLPHPKTKEFRAKHNKIECGKETQIVWEIENAKLVELHWPGNIEVLSFKGEKTISPAESTDYKLILTALDGTSKEEKLIRVEVYKRIEFIEFSSSSILIPRGLEIELSWSVEHAQQIILRSSDGMNESFKKNHTHSFYPTKSANYWLEAKNGLFNSRSEVIRVEVDNAPQLAKIPSFFEENQIPILDFKLPEIQSIIIDETILEFERMIHPKRKFSISKMLNSILKK
jgi:serine/threonine protein kinase